MLDRSYLNISRNFGRSNSDILYFLCVLGVSNAPLFLSNSGPLYYKVWIYADIC